MQGHVSRFMDIGQVPPWVGLWRELECVLCPFEDFALSEDATDATILGLYAYSNRRRVAEYMVDMHSIQEVTKRIVQEFHPEQVILFGSYAYGTPTPDSDVDLLVILPYDGEGPRKALEILNKVNPEFPADILVRTPEQMQQRLAWNDFFLRDIMEKGKVLYAAAHP